MSLRAERGNLQISSFTLYTLHLTLRTCVLLFRHGLTRMDTDFCLSSGIFFPISVASVTSVVQNLFFFIYHGEHGGHGGGKSLNSLKLASFSANSVSLW